MLRKLYSLDHPRNMIKFGRSAFALLMPSNPEQVEQVPISTIHLVGVLLLPFSIDTTPDV